MFWMFESIKYTILLRKLPNCSIRKNLYIFKFEFDDPHDRVDNFTKRVHKVSSNTEVLAKAENIINTL